jgi:hypothetical protein
LASCFHFEEDSAIFGSNVLVSSALSEAVAYF